MATAFKPKPLDPDELTAALKVTTAHIPRTTGDDARRPPEPASKERPPKTVQVNFACTPDLARIIARLAATEGSTRRAIAKLLHDAGYTEVPHWDLQPVSNRREL